MELTAEMMDKRRKLTDQQVREIIELRAKGATYIGLARAYGVSKTLVCKIVKGYRREKVCQN
jgi:transposase-like protein